MNKLEDRLRKIRDLLTEGLVERDLAVRLALIAALSGEHLLLVGPPGTAKSLVARRLRHAFKDTSYFERLLTRFSVPEELFGPLSIKGLDEDRYERKTESYLPTASIAFLDEIFKANSAILNSLLTLLNEREFDNGPKRVKTPLTAVVGASNELPEGEELDALFDRFLLRLHVDPVSSEGFSDLLKLPDPTEPNVPQELVLTKDDLADLQKSAKNVSVPDDVLKLLEDLRKWCNAEKIKVSDRRWRKVVKLLQTSALTNGRDEVSIWDCWLLQHCLWSDKQHRETVFKWYAGRVGATTDELTQIIKIIKGLKRRLKNDKELKMQSTDAKGNPQYKGKDGKPSLSKKGQKHKDDKPLFKAPEGAINCHSHVAVDRTNNGEGYTRAELKEMLVVVDGRNFEDWSKKYKYLKNPENWIKTDLDPLFGPTKHKIAYVKECLKDIQDIREDVENHRAKIERLKKSFESDIRNHLWVSEDFVKPALTGLDERLKQANELISQLTELKQGYESLPHEEEEPESVPETAAG